MSYFTTPEDHHHAAQSVNPNRETTLGFQFGVALYHLPFSVYASTNQVCPACNLFRSPRELNAAGVCAKCVDSGRYVCNTGRTL